MAGWSALMLVAGSCSLSLSSAGRSEHAAGARLQAEQSSEATRYRDLAERLRKEAGNHASLAAWWSSLAGGKTPGTGTGRYEEAEHCRRLSQSLAESAAEAEATAEMQERLARAEEQLGPRRDD